MRKKIITTITMLLTIFGCGTANSQTLVVWHKDGTTMDVELYTQPQVQFANDKVYITSSVINLEYEANNVLRFTYKGKDTSISSPKNETDYTQEGDKLVFHGINSTDKMALYRVDGIRVPVNFIYNGNDAILSLSSIPSGIYVLSVNGKTSKFTKK